MNISQLYPNAPQVDSDSPEFQHVAAYIKAASGLDFSLVEERLGYPGGPILPAGAYTQVKMVFPAGVELDAYLAYASPQMAVGDLMHSLGRAAVGIPPFVPYHKDSVSPAPPTPVAPSVLVGPEHEDGSGRYHTVAGDASPAGTEVTDSRGKFRKIIKRTPFGGSSWWEKVV